jgi:hypothetical protein
MEADFTTTRFRRSIAFNTCDSMHDFLKGPRCSDPSPRSKLIEELNKKLTEFSKAGIFNPAEIGTMYNKLTDESTISHPESAAKRLVGIPDIETQTVYVTNNDNAMKILQGIFSYFGHASITDDNNPVKIVMDGGSGGLGALAKVLNTKVSIVNVVTPATACDSAGLSTKDLFGNPILDPIIALVFSLYVIYGAFGLVKTSINELMDHDISDEIKIKAKIKATIKAMIKATIKAQARIHSTTTTTIYSWKCFPGRFTRCTWEQMATYSTRSTCHIV